MTVASVSEPEDRVVLSPADRFALVGKTRSGKTTFSMVLAATVVPPDLAAHDWQVWWVDTKGDPKDIAKLQKLGYVEGDPVTGGTMMRKSWWKNDEPPSHLYYRLRSRADLSVVEQAQHMCRLALQRKRVLLVLDEYTQVIQGPQTPGRELADVFRTGGGLGVGLLGNTQEPAYIPRQLLSQATHLFAFDLSYPIDQDTIRKYIPDYERPPRSERHAFTHVWLDGDALPRYYPTLRAWRSRVVEGA